MKYFSYQIGEHQLQIKMDENAGTIASLLVDGKVPELPAEELARYAAVISLALLQYEVEEVHDEEPGKLTISHARSLWGEPDVQWNQLDDLMVDKNESGIPNGETF